MCNFFEEKFEQINKLKYLMTLAKNDENLKKYKEKIESIFKEFDKNNNREEAQDMLILTPEELAEFNGKDNKPAYITIDGMIYDVTNIELFNESPHNELQLGKDLTSEFKECHGGDMSFLKNISVVGMLAEAEEVEFMEEVEPYYADKRLRIMGTEELAKYNGEGDKPAYVAIDGMIYNVTNQPFLKVNPHGELKFGADISKEYRECHKDNKDLLKNIPVVGVLYDFPENNRGKHDNIELKEFTLEELEMYNGNDGKPAYIAIDDLVYDVSGTDLFKKAPHNELKLGRDLTKEFNSCHKDDKSVLSKIPVVGSIVFNDYEVKPLESNEIREFKVSELSSFDGQGGFPPYIAVFGTVYDLTDVEELGLRDIKLGCDLTGEYKEVYGNDKSALKDLKVAGVLTCSLKEV